MTGLFARTVRSVGALSIVALAAGAAPGAQEPASIAASWAERFDAGDAAGIAALWTEDGVLIRPQTSYSGREEIQTWYRELLELASGKTVHLEQTAEETWAEGDGASGWGTFRITVDGENLEKGQYVFRAVRDDGVWRWTRLWTQAIREGIEVEVDPATLDGYVGVYRNAVIGQTLGITRDGDRLFLSPPGARPVPLSPEGQDRFFFGGGNKMLFERDEAGKVVGLNPQGPNSPPGSFVKIK